VAPVVEVRNMEINDLMYIGHRARSGETRNKNRETSAGVGRLPRDASAHGSDSTGSVGMEWIGNVGTRSEQYWY
jgi:hypothetical protein